jgi:bifunctional non-homologous end joining protein LigD
VLLDVPPEAGAPVSTPLKWSEVRRGLDPSKFTIKRTAKRLDKVGDLWAPALGPGSDLAGCLDPLARATRA